MGTNVVKLPTAATSYYTVHKRGGWFALMLVTPCPGKNLKTRLAEFSDRDQAIQAAKSAAARTLRPFKMRGAQA